MIDMRSDVRALLLWTLLLVFASVTVLIALGPLGDRVVLSVALIVGALATVANALPRWIAAQRAVTARHQRERGDR